MLTETRLQLVPVHVLGVSALLPTACQDLLHQQSARDGARCATRRFSAGLCVAHAKRSWRDSRCFDCLHCQTCATTLKWSTKRPAILQSPREIGTFLLTSLQDSALIIEQVCCLSLLLCLKLVHSTNDVAPTRCSWWMHRRLPRIARCERRCRASSSCRSFTSWAKTAWTKP